MAPLDTGSVTHVLRLADSFGRGPGPSTADFDTLGDFFRAMREHRGLSLAQVADATRIRHGYLAAVERGDLSHLPSRPFAVGYVRAYARVLGLDGDAAVARFKAEHPDTSEALRAPVGVAPERDTRRRVLYAALGVVVAAVALWNVAQRTLTSDQPGGPVFAPGPRAWPEPDLKGPMVLGAPTPPPADQTTPKPYATPGLGVPGIDSNAAAVPGDPKPTPAATGTGEAAAAPPAIFASHATVYGVPARGGQLIVQATKPASLVIRGATGTIYFARQLQAGEAFRAPLGLGLTADVSDPTAFEVYLGGKLQGPLTDPRTPLDKAAELAAQPAGAATLPASHPTATPPR